MKKFIQKLTRFIPSVEFYDSKSLHKYGYIVYRLSFRHNKKGHFQASLISLIREDYNEKGEIVYASTVWKFR